jgi:hypothetical protein
VSPPTRSGGYVTAKNPSACSKLRASVIIRSRTASLSPALGTSNAIRPTADPQRERFRVRPCIWETARVVSLSVRLAPHDERSLHVEPRITASAIRSAEANRYHCIRASTRGSVELVRSLDHSVRTGVEVEDPDVPSVSASGFADRERLVQRALALRRTGRCVACWEACRTRCHGWFRGRYGARRKTHVTVRVIVRVSSR